MTPKLIIALMFLLVVSGLFAPKYKVGQWIHTTDASAEQNAACAKILAVIQGRTGTQYKVEYPNRKGDFYIWETAAGGCK